MRYKYYVAGMAIAFGLHSLRVAQFGAKGLLDNSVWGVEGLLLAFFIYKWISTKKC